MPVREGFLERAHHFNSLPHIGFTLLLRNQPLRHFIAQAARSGVLLTTKIAISMLRDRYWPPELTF